MLQCSPQKSHGFSKAEKFFVRVAGKKDSGMTIKIVILTETKKLKKKPDKVVLMIELADIITIRVIT